MSTHSGEIDQQSNAISINMISSQVDTSIAQISSIRSILFSNIHSYDDFTKMRQSLAQVLYETETSISFLLKKVAELAMHFNSLTSELNKSSIINEELDNKLSSTYELIEEMKYGQDILDSQVKYYKKQCLEKDKYIIYLKERMSSVESQCKENDISYINYNNITLPERIKREKVPTEVRESNFDYGYDYKEDTNRNINSLSASFNNNNNTKEEMKENIERKATISRKIQNVMNNLCHCDSKIVDLLTKKYGGEIIEKISSGDIDYETVDKVEKDIYQEKDTKLLRAQTMKEETRKYLSDKTGKSSMKGWERLKGYLKLGKEDKTINRLHTMK